MLCQKPHPEKCAKNPTQKKTGLTGNPKVKSQGQIFQECQGQIPRSNISGIPRSNPNVKNVRNAKVKSQGQECQECQGQIPKVKWETTKNRKKPVLTGKSVTKKKKPKTLKEMSIL